MAGWELKDGKLSTDSMSQEQFWIIIKKLVSGDSKNTTTYKFCFMKAILDNLFNVNQELALSFDVVFETMAEIYWNLLVKYHLKQSFSTKQNRGSIVVTIVENTIVEGEIGLEIPYESLDKALRDKYNKTVKRELSKYVIGATYSDTEGFFYGFSKKEKYLILHSDFYHYALMHKTVIEKLNYYQWIQFMEKVNPKESAYGLCNKLDYSSSRNSLEKYKEVLFDESIENICFYCGKKITRSTTHVDHFIPWSFLKADNLWNFVLACPRCNLKKSNSIPDEEYLKKLFHRNKELMDVAIDFVRQEFENYSDNKLLIAYESSLQNGFCEGWK